MFACASQFWQVNSCARARIFPQLSGVFGGHFTPVLKFSLPFDIDTWSCEDAVSKIEAFRFAKCASTRDTFSLPVYQQCIVDIIFGVHCVLNSTCNRRSAIKALRWMYLAYGDVVSKLLAFRYIGGATSQRRSNAEKQIICSCVSIINFMRGVIVFNVLQRSQFRTHVKLFNFLTASMKSIASHRVSLQPTNNVVYLWVSLTHNHMYIGQSIRGLDVRIAEHYNNIFNCRPNAQIPAYSVIRSLGIGSFVQIPLVYLTDSNAFEMRVLERQFIAL